MAKKLKINEQQLSLIVNYIKEGTEPVVLTEENILEEGFKDWAIAGLMTLASIGGVQAQKLDALTQDHINAAQAVQNKLVSQDLDGDGVKDLRNYFKQADIDLNQANIEKLMKADMGKDLETYKTRSHSSAKAKLKQGYAMTDVQVTKDTVWKDIPQPASIDSLIETKFDGNVFATADYELNEEVKGELDFLVSKIEAMNGTITSINIESSTDTEPIQMGNDKLAQLRADGIKNYLGSLGVDTAMVKVETKPEQGPDVYRTTMGSDEREEARQQTEEFRYVNVDIRFEVVPAAETEQEVSRIIEKIQFQLVREKPTYTTKRIHKRGGKKTKTKKFKCKINTGKNKSIPCFKF